MDIKVKRSVSVQVRLPLELKQRAIQVVEEYKKRGQKITESDVYRSAIEQLLSTVTTNSNSD